MIEENLENPKNSEKDKSTDIVASQRMHMILDNIEEHPQQQVSEKHPKDKST
jgi:hypothetical protein